MVQKYRLKSKNFATMLTRIPHEMASLSYLEPPGDWDAWCNEIAADAGITLEAKAREALWHVLYRYLIDCLAVEQLPSAAEVKETLETIERAARSLSTVIDKAISAGSMVPATISHYGNYGGDNDSFYDLPSQLQRLENSCRKALDDFDAHTVGNGRGRPARPGFRRLITRLETIYFFCGGKVSTAWSPNTPDGEMRWTPFIRFCFAAHCYAVRCAPYEVTGGSIDRRAFGETVNFIKKKNETDGDIYDDALTQSIADGLSA